MIVCSPLSKSICSQRNDALQREAPASGPEYVKLCGVDADQRQEDLETQWIQVKMEISSQYLKADIMFRVLEPPDPLPDLREPGTFVVKGQLSQGDHEGVVDLACTSLGRGKFEFPIHTPTSLSPRAAAGQERARQAEEHQRWLEEQERLLEESSRLSPEEEAELAAREAENERIAEAERLVAERRRRDKLAWANHVLEGGEQIQREGIPPEVRRVVYERCGGKCVECGSSFDLHYDHILALALGGSNSVNNLQLLCSTCNLRKGASI